MTNLTSIVIEIGIGSVSIVDASSKPAVVFIKIVRNGSTLNAVYVPIISHIPIAYAGITIGEILHVAAVIARPTIPIHIFYSSHIISETHR